MLTTSHGRPEVDNETPEKDKMEKPKKAKNEEKSKMEVDDETPQKERIEKPKNAKNEEKSKMEENPEQIWVGEVNILLAMFSPSPEN